MGIGDELMAAGEARRRATGTARRFAIVDGRRGKPRHRWETIWEGNPLIARPGERYDEEIPNYPGFRPYIVAKGPRAWAWRTYGPHPADLVLAPSEAAIGEAVRGCIVVQPTIKASASRNKLWPWDAWQRLIERRPGLPWVQVGDGTEPVLQGVRFVRTRTFREACGVLAAARAAVLHEGGLHHAAAAVGLPAVVIFGGFIAPSVTGYPMHTNLFRTVERFPLGCGMRFHCPHCKQAMEDLKPYRVLEALEEILERR